MRTRTALVGGLLAATVGLAGCGPSTADGPATVTVGTITNTPAPTATITRTIPGSATGGGADPGSGSVPTNPGLTSGPTSGGPASGLTRVPSSPGSSSSRFSSSSRPAKPPAFPTAAPTEGRCPFLKSSDVSLLAGQRVGRVELIAASPQPICVFYRIVDGGWLGAVRVIDAGGPAQAVAAVDAAVPPADSSPADELPGWGGGYMLLPSGDRQFPDSRAIYAVSKGSHAVIAWNSRNQTVKSRRMAEAAISALHW